MKKLAFILPALGTGGAERVVSTLLKYMDKDKYELYLILLREEGDYFNDIPNDINVVLLKGKRTRYVVLELVKKLREISPDIVFSTLRGVSAIISFIQPVLPRKTKLIFREENTPSVSINSNSNAYFFNLYYNTLYKKADLIICQSNYMQNDLIKHYNFPVDKTLRIYNPLDFEAIERNKKKSTHPFANTDDYNVIVVGRMSKQKGIDILLESVKEGIDSIKKNNVRIYIIGDGELLSEYKNMAKNMKIDSYINFVGRQNNPYQWMQHADLFVLPSRYEGLPNVLLEAIACGCDVITTSHPGGTREIMEIIDKEDNIVDNIVWNFKKNVNKEPANLEKLKEYFDVKLIIKKYEEVFDKI